MRYIGLSRGVINFVILSFFLGIFSMAEGHNPVAGVFHPEPSVMVTKPLESFERTAPAADEAVPAPPLVVEAIAVDASNSGPRDHELMDRLKTTGASSQGQEGGS